MNTNTEKKGFIARGKRLFERSFWTLRRIVILSVLLLVVVIFTVFFVRTQLSFVPRYERVNQKVDAPFTVTLNQYVKSMPLSELSISPAVEGSWKHQEGSLFEDDTLTFTPRDYFAVDTTYTVELPTIERAIIGEIESTELRFTTEKAPGLRHEGIESLPVDAPETVSSDYVFRALLSSPNRGLRSLKLRTEPSLKLQSKVMNDREYTWSSSKLLPQGKTVTLELYDEKNKSVLAKRTVRIAKEPTLSALKKTTDYLPGDPVALVFTQPVALDQEKMISFNVEGAGVWEDEKTYSFTPKQIKPNKTYSYTIKKGLRSKQGGILSKTVKGDVKSRGAVRVIASSPQGSELSQSYQQLSFTFNQPVDKKSVIDRLSISHGKLQAAQWQGQTLRIGVKNLGFQRTVTATIAAGVKNTDFGAPSVAPYAMVFTTEVRRKSIAMPEYQQQYAGSCTAASLRMILASRGIQANDREIVGRMGYSPHPYNKKTGVWDDPQQMFVGKIDGSIRDRTGAGPDAPPVAKAAQSYGLSAQAVRGIGVNWVAEQIYAGHPVISFGAFSSGAQYVEWKTPTGAKAKMHITGHARTVTGVVGEPDRPLGFWVNDPLYGRQYWSAGELAANMALDPYRQAVVVY